ncbi:hypothetical protein [Metabacillus idriensis]|uniref:hypothetical protein n=1 Tax=Metabacillus idriensis TaxID=324768 RepID=UPI003D28AF88
MSAPEPNQKVNKFVLWITIPIFAAMLFFLSFSLGKNSATTDISGEKLSYDNLQSVIAEKQTELTFLKKEIEDINDERIDEEKEYDEVIAIISDKEKFESQFKEAKENLANVNTQLAELNKKVEAKKKELAALEGKIEDKKK